MSEDARRRAARGASRPPRAPDELDRLTSEEYEPLRDLTHRLRLRGIVGPAGPETDSLVHETYLRLRNGGHASWRDKTHFLAVAALQLRHLLVDHARRLQAQKRGGEQVRVSLDADAIPAR